MIYRVYSKMINERLYSNEEDHGIFTKLSISKKAAEDLSKMRTPNENFVIEELKKKKQKFEVVGEHRLVDGEWIYENLDDFFEGNGHYNTFD